MRRWGLALVSAAVALAPLMAAAEVDNQNLQPYVDSLLKKNHLTPRKAEPDLAPVPHSEAPIKPQQQFSDDPNEVQPHIQKLLNDSRTSGVEKSDAQKNGTQPYLEMIKEKKDLQPNFKGKVSQAAGFSIVAANTFHVTSTEVQANSFDQVYNPQNKYAPSADVFYERELYRNQYVGALGLIGHLNIISISGKGVFTKLQTTSQTNFKFYAIPVTLGGEYRFLQLRWVQPYVQLGAVGIPYFETRDDGFPSRKGIARGYNVTGGMAINLDWVSRSAAWDQYEDSGVLHTYLIAQMEFLRPIAGAVSFNYTGTYVGLMFEF